MSTVLDTLITDRTQADIYNDTDRAYICYLDLNRIEEACRYLAEYLGVRIITKVWIMEDFRSDKEMQRIRQNIQTLREAYFAKESTPSTPTRITFSSINQANDVEQILKDIGVMCENMVSGETRLAFKLGIRMLGNRR